MATGAVVNELILGGTDEFALEGTDEWYLSDFGTLDQRYAGSPFRGSFIVRPGYRAEIMEEVMLGPWDEVEVQGDGELYISDNFGTRGEIILSGR